MAELSCSLMFKSVLKYPLNEAKLSKAFFKLIF